MALLLNWLPMRERTENLMGSTVSTLEEVMWTGFQLTRVQ